jgi:hypothetical protein
MESPFKRVGVGGRRQSTDTPRLHFCTVMVAPVMGRPLEVGLPWALTAVRLIW